jgi:hypothetical protein
LLLGLSLELPAGISGAATWPKALTARRTKPPPVFLIEDALRPADLATPRIVLPTDLTLRFAVTPAFLAADFFLAGFPPVAFRDGDFFDL